MSWLRVNVHTPAGNGELEMDGTTVEHRQSIIDGFMGIFGVKSQSKPVTESNNDGREQFEGLSKLTREIGAATSQTVADAARGLQCIGSGETVIPLSKISQAPKKPFVEITKPPLIGSERNLTTPIAELVSKAVESGRSPSTTRRALSTRMGCGITAADIGARTLIVRTRAIIISPRKNA